MPEQKSNGSFSLASPWWFTDKVIRQLAEHREHLVFILWGSHARKKASRVPALGRSSHHLVLTSAHPSPLSAHNGFFGSRPFSQVNAFLSARGAPPIDWRLP